jgi:hypothetical protein
MTRLSSPSYFDIALISVITRNQINPRHYRPAHLQKKQRFKGDEKMIKL